MSLYLIIDSLQSVKCHGLGKVWRYQREVIRTVNRRRADNTMRKGKKTKGKTTINKAVHRKLKTAKQESH